MGDPVIKFQFLRYSGNSKTGLQVTFHDKLVVGYRWSKWVWNAPRGFFLIHHPSGLQLNAFR